MTEPLVSIKMITYNHAPYIAQAIEGVLQQKTDFPFELVIGEDCSTDGTRDIVFEYQKKYPDIIRVVTSDRNVGAKKNGLRTAKVLRGKYVAFCEGDDYWHHPEKLRKQVIYMESHPECGLVYSSYDLYYVRSKKRIVNIIEKNKWHMPNSPTILDFFRDASEIGYGILTCTTMVRRDLYEKILESDPYLYKNDNFLRGDTQLWAEIAHISSVHYIPESLATYTQTEESATRSKDITKVVKLQIADAELVLYLCKKYDLPLSAIKDAESMYYNGLLRLAFHTRNATLAEEARRNKETLTYKEWLLYYGAINIVFYYPFRVAVSFRNSWWKLYHQWL